MEEIVLQANHREAIGKQVKVLRRKGMLPAIIYGKGISPIPISLDYRVVSRVLSKTTTSHLVVVDLGDSQHTTLVRERQRHPVTGNLLHIDFLEVSLTETLRTSVMIELKGESPAVKNYNGVVVTGIETLEVECLPNDLPERIIVDISILNEIGDSIFIRDIPVPPNVEFLTDPDEMLVLITHPVAEEEEEVEEIEELEEEEEPEVIERGKKEEEPEEEET
jgi:large subunit ribosomal protein L25